MSELVDVFDETFFAPVATGMVEDLVAGYQNLRVKIEQVSALFQGDVSGVVYHFIEGNRVMGNSRYSSLSAEKIFEQDGAIRSLDATYWNKAMGLTNVWECMPQKRRDEWSESIREMTCPAFEEETVRATLQSLIHSRSKFFAERVDGIFRALSHEHVTNSPMGFGKRMILNYAITSYGCVNHSVAGYIDDLRAVIAKFMGRDDPHWGLSMNLIQSLRDNLGEWHTVDGGALRIRLYKKGTAHLEVHPDMAWRLNAILANLHPQAIPAEFRTRPKSRAKDFVLMERPLPFAVVGALQQAHCVASQNQNSVWLRTDAKPIAQEAGLVLEAIGGVWIGKNEYQFDYDPRSVLAEIIRSGCIPDSRSHQFYPTPHDLAQEVVDLAGIEPHHVCLEPSAGNGGLADFMPKAQTTCVEINELRCKVLKAKGYRWLMGDFLAMGMMETYDRIIMNPPFSGGRAKAHVIEAARLLKHGGRLVAILPPSAKDIELPGFTSLSWSEPRSFPGTYISVVILVAE